MQTRHGEFVEQTRQSLVKYRVAVARRPIAQRATNPTFADSGWPDQKDVEVLADPSASCQRLNRRTIQAAGSTQVEIFQARMPARRSRCASAALSAAVCWRSTSSAKRSSNDNAVRSG